MMKKVLYTLNIGDYEPEIREFTYPLLKWHARKMGAEFVEIAERKFPDWPVTYEKLQIQEMAKRNGADWHVFYDADSLIHPSMPDLTEFIPFDTVAHHNSDYAPVRWRSDEYFKRDGRNIGSGNWCTYASKLCLDLWTPLDISLADAIERIFPIVEEMESGHCSREHLIDDYTLSRNIARFGLKFTTLSEIVAKMPFKEAGFWLHQYRISNQEKIDLFKKRLEQWKVDLSKYR